MSYRLAVAMFAAVLTATAATGAAPKPKAKPTAAAVQLDAKHALAVKAAFLQVKNARSALPLSALQKSKAAALEKKLNAAQRAARARLGSRLLAAVRVSAKTKKPVFTKAFVSSIRNDVKLLGSNDVAALTALVLQAAADEAAQDLYRAAKQTEASLQRKKRLRDSVAQLRQVLASWRAKSRSVSWTEADGRHLSKVMTKSGAEALLKRLEAELAAQESDSEMMSLNLQDVMQKREQVLQMLSNMMKAMHDSTQAIINNLK